MTGTVTSPIRADQSWAFQYSSKSGWASQSSNQRPFPSTDRSATGVASFSAFGSIKAAPIRINAEGSVISPRCRDRCSSKAYIMAFQNVTRLRHRAPPWEYQRPEYQLADVWVGAIDFRPGFFPRARAHWVMPR